MKLFKMALIVLLTAWWALPASALNFHMKARSSLGTSSEAGSVIARAGYRVENLDEFYLFEAQYFFLQFELGNATLDTSDGELLVRAYGPDGLYDEFAAPLSGGGTDPASVPYGSNISSVGGGVYELRIAPIDWSDVDVYVQDLAFATSSPLPILAQIEGANPADRGIRVPVDQVMDCDQPFTVTIRFMFDDPRAGFPVMVASDELTLPSGFIDPVSCS